MNEGATHHMVLGIIENPKSTQQEIGAFYVNAIDRWYIDQTSVNIAALNAAILKRYRPSGLDRIKKIAWDIIKKRGQR